MGNRFQIPSEVEQRLRDRFGVCAYCHREMKAYPERPGCPSDKASIEHLNRHGPFYWSRGLKESELVIACCSCNSSRGVKRLGDWFDSAYCKLRGINAQTVHQAVKDYLLLPIAEE